MVTVSGTLTDEEGSAIVGATVIVIDEVNENVAATATTDTNGDWSVSVGSNSYHVLIQYSDSNGDLFNTDSYPFVQ